MAPAQQEPIADAHADSLMWNRDLNARSKAGHADFPRLIEGGVKVQAFTIVTRGLPFVDGFRFFAWRHGWPRAARRSPLARALWQAERLARFCEKSSGRAALVRTRAELDANLNEGRLSAVLGVEGAYALEGNLANLQRLHDAGVRFLGPSHLIPNEFASCSYWAYRDRGLTPLGRDLLAEMARLRMGLDLAHASPRAIADMLATPFPAAFNSHTGVRGATKHWRNLSDEELRAIAARDGVVAIVLARKYLGGPGLTDFAAHVRHAARVIGSERVAIGSDFDGFVAMPREIRDAADFGRIAPALEAAGFAHDEWRGIVGGNLIAFFRRMLPENGL